MTMRAYACVCVCLRVSVRLCVCVCISVSLFPAISAPSIYICSDISIDSRKVFTNTPKLYLDFAFRTESYRMGENTRDLQWPIGYYAVSVERRLVFFLSLSFVRSSLSSSSQLIISVAMLLLFNAMCVLVCE